MVDDSVDWGRLIRDVIKDIETPEDSQQRWRAVGVNDTWAHCSIQMNFKRMLNNKFGMTYYYDRWIDTCDPIITIQVENGEPGELATLNGIATLAPVLKTHFNGKVWFDISWHNLTMRGCQLEVTPDLSESALMSDTEEFIRFVGIRDAITYIRRRRLEGEEWTPKMSMVGPCMGCGSHTDVYLCRAGNCPANIREVAVCDECISRAMQVRRAWNIDDVDTWGFIVKMYDTRASQVGNMSGM